MEIDDWLPKQNTKQTMKILFVCCILGWQSRKKWLGVHPNPWTLILFGWFCSDIFVKSKPWFCLDIFVKSKPDYTLYYNWFGRDLGANQSNPIHAPRSFHLNARQLAVTDNIMATAILEWLSGCILYTNFKFVFHTVSFRLDSWH